MANANTPFGLVPVQYMDGSPWNGAARMYCILAADTNAYYIGDPVTTIGNAGADALFGIPAVTIGSAGAAIRGVVLGIGTNAQGGAYINPNDLTKTYRPSGAQSVNYYALVVDDPNVLYEMQEAGVGSVLTSASVNRNVNFHAGTPATGVFVSGYYLDNNTVNTTSTLNLKIISAVQRTDNTPYAQYQKWLVRINNHEFNAGTTSP